MTIKKVQCVFLAAVLLFISGCGLTVKPEGAVWKMSVILNSEGNPVYCSEENKEIYPEAEISNVVCVAEKGVMNFLFDMGGGTTLRYDRRGNGIYTVYGEKGEGYMTADFTKYADGTKEKTLVMSVDGYAAYFTEGK